jgi:quercetin dioxygenase-like cupin family protein
MYQVNNQINDQEYKGLQIRKLKEHSNLEILSISLEKGSKFPEHTSPEDAKLMLLEGEIIFHINNEAYNLTPHQSFSFPKETPHWVLAKKNSKFIIIR